MWSAGVGASWAPSAGRIGLAEPVAGSPRYSGGAQGAMAPDLSRP
jgi:hypothetical protein